MWIGSLSPAGYFLNTAYNIGNKLVLTALPIPWTSATIELFFGLPYVGMLWLTGLRKKPKLSFDNIKTLAPSAFFLSATHVGGVISFGAGAISFTQFEGGLLSPPALLTSATLKPAGRTEQRK